MHSTQSTSVNYQAKEFLRTRNGEKLTFPLSALRSFRENPASASSGRIEESFDVVFGSVASEPPRLEYGLARSDPAVRWIFVSILRCMGKQEGNGPIALRRQGQ